MKTNPYVRMTKQKEYMIKLCTFKYLDTKSLDS